MAKEELFEQIGNIITGLVDFTEGTEGWFCVLVKGCVFPDEIVQLQELCYVSTISYNVIHECMEISCKYEE